jgi:rhamnulokinase
VSGAHAAVHLEASQGRVVVGRLEGGRLSIVEAHRFPIRAVTVDGTPRWDVHRLYGEVLAGLRAVTRRSPEVASAAIDGWGMDFGLLDSRGKLLGLPRRHRVARPGGISARLRVRLPDAEVWASAGVQPQEAHTLYQLHGMALRRSSTLARTARVLLIPDLLRYWLCGEQAVEHTIASTTGCYDTERHAWIGPLLARARVPEHVFPPAIAPATPVGPVRTGPARRAGIPAVQVVAPACHAAASALAAVPADGASFAYVSVGTWARAGAVTPQPVRTEAAWRQGFTNDACVDGAVSVHRETAGLGLIEACRSAWARAGAPLEGDAAIALAATGRPFLAAVDLDDVSFLAPDDLPGAVRAACARTSQAVVETRADLLRVILESLAWRFRRTLRALEGLLGRRLETIHMIGEGARNALLCQLTADACGRPVLAGPVDAAALGNVLAQAIAAGACASWSEGRRLVAAAFPPVRYEPSRAAEWDEAGARLELLDAAG